MFQYVLQIFSPCLRLAYFSHLIMSFDEYVFLILKNHHSLIVLVGLYLLCLYLPSPSSWRHSTVFSSRNCLVLCLNFVSTVPVKFILYMLQRKTNQMGKNVSCFNLAFSPGLPIVLTILSNTSMYFVFFQPLLVTRTVLTPAISQWTKQTVIFGYLYFYCVCFFIFFFYFLFSSLSFQLIWWVLIFSFLVLKLVLFEWSTFP